MKLSFNGITKQLTSSAIEGGVLYAAVKGYKVANHLSNKIVPASIPAPIKNVGVALAVAFMADQFAPKKYRSLIGAGAMSEAIAAFVDPYVDPMLLKSDLIGMASLSTLSSYQIGIAGGAIPAGTAAPMSGYGRLGGYSSSRMGGYAGGNLLGMHGINLLGQPS